DAPLDPLQLVAGTGADQQHERVDHVVDLGLGLADPDGLDEHGVEPSRFAHQPRLTRAPRDTAQRTASRARAHVRAGVLRQRAHARLVAQDRAAAARARRVDREYRDTVALFEQAEPEGLDECRLADTGGAADADARRSTGAAQQCIEERGRIVAVVRPGRLDQRDRACERTPVTRNDPRSETCRVGVVAVWGRHGRASSPSISGLGRSVLTQATGPGYARAADRTRLRGGESG